MRSCYLRCSAASLTAASILFLTGSLAAQSRAVKPNPNAKEPSAIKSQQVDNVPPDKTAEVRRGEELIKKVAFGKTQSARSVEDFTSIIDTCQQGLQSGVEPATVEYASKLMSWAHNRRGELLASRAGGAREVQQKSDLEGKALSDFETACSLDETNWRALHNRGVSMAQMRRHDEALKDFSKTIELNPKYGNAWFNRGELRYLLGKYAEAIEDYNQAIRVNPSDWAAYNSRGHARYRVGQYREALEDYNQSVQLNANNAAAYTNRGDVFADQGNYERAAQDYRKAIELNPKHGRAYQSVAWLMATCPEDRFRDQKKAIESAQKALEIDGWNDFHYVDALAAAYANAGRYDDAVESLKKALEMVKGRPDAAKPMQERLALYEQNKPYRATPRLASRPATDSNRRSTANPPRTAPR